MSKDNTWNPDVQPDFEKLGKLDKFLGKIEGDIQNRIKDMDKPQFVETLKKCHEVYQLVLGELHFQLCELGLEKYGDIIMKIFIGQNNLVNILLKLKTNLDFNPENLIKNLQNLRKAQQKGEDFDQEEETKVKDEVPVVQRVFGRKNNQNSTTNVNVSKVLVDSFTSTTLDFMSLKDIEKLKQKNKNKMEEIEQEMEEGQDDIEKFLAERKDFNAASQAENQLKNVLKDLAFEQKKLKNLQNDHIIGDEQNLNNKLDMQNFIRGNNKNYGFQRKQYAPGMKLDENQKVVNGEVIEIKDQETCTEDQTHLKYPKLNEDHIALQKEHTKQTKEFKEMTREYNFLNDSVKKMTTTINELKVIIEKMKNAEEKRLEAQQRQVIMGKAEKEKFKAITSDNIKMKLKLKELFDVITNFEKDNKNNIQKFKNYILGSSGYTDEQKRKLIEKIEELFTANISSKVNLRELECMSVIDENLLSDKFIRDCIGDPKKLIQQIKAQEKDNQQKFKNKNYDPDFDPDLLLPSQEIQIRKVKKLIKRKDSKTGEWIEEEIEVDEMVVVDKLTGEIIRSKEVVNNQNSAILSKNMNMFMNEHGGLAIGGAKFKKPEPVNGQKPKAKDGKPIVEGEWFEDEKGNMVRMKRNAKGEEVYEVKETYIDENGIQRERIKQVQYKKDANGNDVVIEEYIDPKTGQKYRVEKKQYRDKDGNMVIEEVTIGADGQRTVKRTKVKKDKNGNEIITEETIDHLGRKQIIQTKVMKDENGNDVIVQEILDADGTKTIITEKIGSNGQKIVVKETQLKDGTKLIVTETVDESGAKIQITEKVDKRGKKEIISEKKIRMGNDGNLIIQEYETDEKGNKIMKDTRMERDENGYEVKVSEVWKDGKKLLVKTKVIKGEDGQDILIEETIDENGNVITKQVKAHFDEHGNQIIVEEITDANGNKIIRTKKINVDGSIQIEEYNAKTGEKKIIKQIKDENGRTIIEEVTIDKNGKKTIKNVIKSVDQFGNEILQEIYVDSITGKQVVVNKKVTYDKQGRQIIEEQEVDENGKVRNIKTKIYVDADGSEITEKEIIGSDGKKQKIRQKKYLDQYGNTIIEEERIDENGNRVIVKRQINKDGTESIVETTIGRDGKKHIVKRNIKADGTVDQEVTTADGKTYKITKKLGFDDKEQQTDAQTLESLLSSMGIDQDKINQMQNFFKNGKMTKLTQAEINAQRKKAQKDANLESGSEDEDNLQEIDDNMTLEQQQDLLYKKLLAQGGEVARNIRNQLGLDGNQFISKEQFDEYLKRLRDVHVKCGENCPHLKRFYAKLGFMQSKYTRKFLKMNQKKIQTIDKKLEKM